MFWLVSVQLGKFGCLTILVGKRAELVQKFVPRSRVRIFRNECTQSTPLYPKLTFWCILHYFRCIRDRLVALRNSELNGRTTAKVRATKSRRNFLQRMLSICPVGPQTDVLVHFVLFGCIRDRLVALRNSVQNGTIWCKNLCHEVASEFFVMNAPDPAVGP